MRREANLFFFLIELEEVNTSAAAHTHLFITEICPETSNQILTQTPSLSQIKYINENQTKNQGQGAWENK